MRRALVALFALALVGMLAADVAAQQPRSGQTTRGGQPSRVGDARQRPDNGNCGQLGQLRQELARLHQELRQLQAALAEARKNGNRERPEDRYYFAAPYHSWHGSPSKRDSEIPLIVAHPARSDRVIASLVRSALGDGRRQERLTDLLIALRFDGAPAAVRPTLP